MKKTGKITLMILMVILQLAVPLYMIKSHQITLLEGQQFKFKAAPVDPYDPFMGRYININLEERSIPVEDVRQYRSGKTVYVALENAADGYAKVSGISFNRPNNPAYFKTKIAYIENTFGSPMELDMNNLNPTPGKVHFEIPFNRYYLPENLALKAEKEWNKVLTSRSSEVYITARIHQGNSAIENVYISGESIVDYLNKVDK